MEPTVTYQYRLQAREYEDWYEEIDPAELATAEAPPTADLTENAARAGNALAALRAYAERTGDCHTDAKTVLADFFADLLHLGDLLDVDIYDAINNAEVRYDEEIGGDIFYEEIGTLSKAIGALVEHYPGNKLDSSIDGVAAALEALRARIVVANTVKRGRGKTNRITGEAAYVFTMVVNDLHEQIGAVVKIMLPGAKMAVWVAQAHNWDGDREGYDPINLGAFEDPDQAFAEIERRAREAQAPETIG